MNLTIKQIVDVTNNFFPVNAAILITGSQHKNTVFYHERDIDIVVFHPFISDVWANIVLESNSFKLDYTLLPLCNIPNVLANDFQM